MYDKILNESSSIQDIIEVIDEENAKRMSAEESADIDVRVATLTMDAGNGYQHPIDVLLSYNDNAGRFDLSQQSETDIESAVTALDFIDGEILLKFRGW